MTEKTKFPDLPSKYTVGIAEKPSAAKKIAQALDDKGKPFSGTYLRAPYYVCDHKGEKIVILAALGHLFELQQEGKGWYYPSYDFYWSTKKNEKEEARLKPFIDLIEWFVPNSDKHVVMTDYDVEGEVIGAVTLKKVGGEKVLANAKRMCYSALTKKALQTAYLELNNQINHDVLNSGLTRHYVDWLFGINVSRALSLSLKNITGWFYPLSAGRVQAPTLAFVVEREAGVRSFVPVPYWVIDAEMSYNGTNVTLKHTKRRIRIKSEAKKIEEKCKSEKAQVSKVESKIIEDEPLNPFNLGSLQSESYRVFKYTPSYTLVLAEKLYLDALISYPRTNSEKFPEELDHTEIIANLKKQRKYSNISSLALDKGTKPHEGSKTDPAHPPIYPTGAKPDKKLEGAGEKLYDLIVKRYLSLFGEKRTREQKNITIAIDSEEFKATNTVIIEPGWTKIYDPYTRDLKSDPVLKVKVGDELKVNKITLDDKLTKSPPRYNENSLLNEMTKQGIGTKATRAATIDKLRTRGYVEEYEIIPTVLGEGVISLLRDYVPNIITPEMTRDLEHQMEKVGIGEEKLDNVLSEAIKNLQKVLDKFKENEYQIGKELQRRLSETLNKRRIVLGSCPNCQTGNLIAIKSRATRKQFVGCTNYEKDGSGCSTSAPLPARSKIIPTEKVCEIDGYPIVEVERRGRKWEMCVNIECSTRTINEKKNKQKSKATSE
ncbi:MAG: DNA topoisomerase I [Candidatus Kariarchaeaceae archaeon]